MHRRPPTFVAPLVLLCSALGCASSPAPGPSEPGSPPEEAKSAPPTSTESDADGTSGDSTTLRDGSALTDPSKTGIVGRMAPRDTVTAKHSLSLHWYDVEVALPEGVVLQRVEGTAGHAWTGPNELVIAVEDAVPMKLAADREPLRPRQIAGMFAERVGLSPDAVGEGTISVCVSGRRKLRGYEWSLSNGAGSLWVVVFEYEDADPRPDGFRSFLGTVVVGGPAGSPFAADGEATKAVRDSLRVTSMFDSKLELRMGSCPPEV